MDYVPQPVPSVTSPELRQWLDTEHRRIAQTFQDLRDATPAGIDHGSLTGLGDDDHPQYMTQAESDARYAAIGSGVTDHGALTGLGDDDHPQYARLAANNTFTGQQIFSGVIYPAAGWNKSSLTPDLITYGYAGGSPVLSDGIQTDHIQFVACSAAEKKAAGGSFSSSTIPNASITDGRASCNFSSVDSIAPSQDAVRYTFPCGYVFIDSLLMTGSTSGNSVSFLVEWWNGSIWQTVGASSEVSSSWPGHHLCILRGLTGGGASLVRITITRTHDNSNNVDIAKLKLLGTYGPGAKRLFDWNANRDVVFAGGAEAKMVSAVGASAALWFHARDASRQFAWYANDSTQAMLYDSVRGTHILAVLPAGYMQVVGSNGSLYVGPQNTGLCHYITDRAAHYFSPGISVNGLVADYGSSQKYRFGPWVHFTTSGGTVTLQNWGDVSSVSDNGVGDFTMNFSLSMGTSAYGIGGFVHVSGQGNCNSVTGGGSTAFTATTCRFNVRGTGGINDPTNCAVIVLR